MREFSEIIKELRLRTGKTQTELAEVFGFDESTVSGWKGRDTYKWLGPVVSLCEENNYDLNEIILGHNPQPTNPASLEPLSADERKAFLDLAKIAVEVLSRESK